MPDPQNPAPRYRVTVFIGQGEEMVPFGRTRDLSVSGMFLETEARPELGSEQTVAIVWGDDTCECKAKVVRHADDGIGMTFVTPDATFMNAVREIITSANAEPVSDTY
jgi:hypothetical protein